MRSDTRRIHPSLPSRTDFLFLRSEFFSSQSLQSLFLNSCLCAHNPSPKADIIALFQEKSEEEIIEQMMLKYGDRPDVCEEEIRICISDVRGLKEQGKLFYKTSCFTTSQFISGSPPKKSTSRFVRLPEFSTRKSRSESVSRMCAV